MFEDDAIVDIPARKAKKAPLKAQFANWLRQQTRTAKKERIMHTVRATRTPVLAATARLKVFQEEASSGIGNDRVREVVQANPGLATAVKTGSRIGKCLPIAEPAASLAMFYISKYTKCPEKIEEFVDRLSDGVKLPLKYPILVARRILFQDKLRARLKEPSAHALAQSAIVISAWNLYVTGKEVRSIHYKPGQYPAAV